MEKKKRFELFCLMVAFAVIAVFICMGMGMDRQEQTGAQYQQVRTVSENFPVPDD